MECKVGVAGDVAEVYGLNHYIGMEPLGDAATLERRTAPYGVAAPALLAVVAAAVGRRWTAVLGLAIVFPADLAYWLWYYGHHLDPTAP